MYVPKGGFSVAVPLLGVYFVAVCLWRCGSEMWQPSDLRYSHQRWAPQIASRAAYPTKL